MLTCELGRGYQDEHMELADLGLKISYWFVTHKEQFRQWRILSVLGLNFLFLIFTVVAGSIYLSEIPRYGRLLARAASATPQAAIERTRPVPIEVRGATAAPVEGKTIDLIAELRNANERWGATIVEYSFTVAGTETPRRTTYLLPGEHRHVFQLGGAVADPSALVPGSVTLTLHDVRWQWVRDPEFAGQSSFAVTDLSFTPRTQTRQGGEAASLRATVTNTGIRGWRSVTVGIVVVDGSTAVGANTVTISAFDAQDKRTIEASWPRAFSPSATVLLEPSTNLFDPKNTLPVS